ncbi:dienelactone hydrolase-like protein [Pirellula staleyi DSM 6068]|uniref:Dienelactone hydrolase-like protein n=1 Tax=Pirellula staleyi (strain ATCC 27377 / DSM 6068 / ICPB 4128) TaxID=530564 RepID=D2QYS3_PIRSD|nr:dienelactone hydrolase [Pirellula staleyi]ADB16378.1 dienelactone hydrolase-like protein [Pirellula staleyi DSM 6068]
MQFTKNSGLLASTLLLLLSGASAVAAEYNPLESKQQAKTEIETLVDKTRKREIPVRFYLPEESGPRPVVLFSHGLGGSRDNNGYIGEHLAGRGYVCIFLQHPGSDESVWKGTKPTEIMPAMQKAASYENLELRCQDVKAVVEQLSVWNKTQGHLLFGRVDPQRIGMSGHSFGASTTQGVLGQSIPLLGPRFLVPEIRAGIAYSPSIPQRGNPETAFAKIDRPFLLMTGTLDDSPIGGQTPASRRKVYPALPTTIDRYELVLDGGKHSAFSEREIKLKLLGGGQKNPNHHRVILAITAAFWDTYLKEDSAAQAWLQGEGPRQIMEKPDLWQMGLKKK